MTLVAIALGSNIEPEMHLQAAAKLLRKQWPAMRFSHVYESAPLERTDQSPFLNAAAVFETNQSISEILGILKLVEDMLGKSPSFRFGPRTIDLDLLLFGNEVSPDLTSWKLAKQKNDPADTQIFVPHLRMHQRRFVLEPLIELIDGEMAHPVWSESFVSLVEKASDQACTRSSVIL